MSAAAAPLLSPARSGAAPRPSDTRERLLEVLRGSPGCPLGDLKARLGVGWGTLYYHLETLQRAGRVRTVVSGRRKLAFLGAEEKDPQEVVGRNMLVGATARGVARAIVATPGLDLQGVGEACGENPRVTYYHVRRLVEAGLVRSASPTRYAGLAPTRLLAALLREMDARGPAPRDGNAPAVMETSCESA
ncbi:MAG TPA: hypothetical protein VNX21_06575 [Candidatus Thermoplasmatota archaeon]|nr:hypothetical protein [Candidatus Thermoplasmatota archaeon]